MKRPALHTADTPPSPYTVPHLHSPAGVWLHTARLRKILPNASLSFVWCSGWWPPLAQFHGWACRSPFNSRGYLTLSTNTEPFTRRTLNKLKNWEHFMWKSRLLTTGLAKHFTLRSEPVPRSSANEEFIHTQSTSVKLETPVSNAWRAWPGRLNLTYFILWLLLHRILMSFCWTESSQFP